MFENLFEQNRYTLMALLSGAILVGSGISLGIGLTEQRRVAVSTGGVSGVVVTREEVDLPEVTEKININTANVDELALLPQIAAKKAKAIVDYREKNGAFGSISEIQNVSGIGPKTFEKLRELITVE